MRARRLTTAVFLGTCAKLAEPEPARHWPPKGPLGRGIEMTAVVGLDAFFTGGEIAPGFSAGICAGRVFRTADAVRFL
ncbi:Hypothetical protein NGAL_HAMBI1146_25290 [Neorhizobium galegae bv. officinalis]|nr:Hypothetical protein NGAL_HAMBI1146_25290 [Neorhizobium galegae bv. officinalis]